MWWAIGLAFQSVTGQSAAGPPDVRPARPAAPARCEDGPPGEVVVCGAPDQAAFRLRPLSDRYAPAAALPRAEMTIVGDLRVSGEAEAGQALGPAPPRAMMRLKLPF